MEPDPNVAAEFENLLSRIRARNGALSWAGIEANEPIFQKIKLFAGYAGWRPGQLEDEMKRKAWLTHPASLELIFDTNPEQLWQTILRQKGWKYKLLAQMPEDLSLN